METEDAVLGYEIDEGPKFNPPKPKKGRASWAYDDPLRIPEEHKDPRFTYRYVINEPRQINRRKAQGFVEATNVNGVDMGNFRGPKSNGIDSIPNTGDLVLMAAYKEVAEEYVGHINKVTDNRERSITREVREDAPVDERTGRRAEVRQRLVIE